MVRGVSTVAVVSLATVNDPIGTSLVECLGYRFSLGAVTYAPFTTPNQYPTGMALLLTPDHLQFLHDW